MRCLKLTLAYDGTNYHGWQVQRASDGLTIQGIIQEKLEVLTKEKIQVTASGRTDAGVHAWGQVVHFVSQKSTIPTVKFPAAMNSVLPSDIRVRFAEEMAPGFHARKMAREKTYRYIIYNEHFLNPFWRYYAYHVPRALNIRAMQLAGTRLIGSHDFRSFCAQGSSVDNYERTLKACRIQREGPLIKIEVTANGFLYHMVRIIVGTLIEVGKDKFSIRDVEAILKARERKVAGPTAPPQGLCLMLVKY